MELLDLYTKDRQPIYKTICRDELIPKNCYHIVVHVCIFNTNGEMLIQQWHRSKTNWSNMWDVSCGGSAITGETSSDAAERETFEELGIKISLMDSRPFITIHIDEGFDDYYIITKDFQLDNICIKSDEVQSIQWATKEEILSMIDSGLFIPHHKDMIGLLFYMQNHRGSFTKKEI